jgi:hypothetical protein
MSDELKLADVTILKVNQQVQIMGVRGIKEPATVLGVTRNGMVLVRLEDSPVGTCIIVDKEDIS